MEGLKTTKSTATATPAAIDSIGELEKTKLQLREKGGFPMSASPAFVQPKLSIGSPDDVYEKEADAMADKVMRMPLPEQISFSDRNNTVSRKCAECEGEEEIHRKEKSNESISLLPSKQNKLIGSSPNKRKTEATYTNPEEEGKGKKTEAGTGALIGAGIGATAGAIIGGLLGGPLGALLGGGIGALLGAGVGALAGFLVGGSSDISWATAGYASDTAAASSTTVERPFNVTYSAVKDSAKKVWQLKVGSIDGGVDINVHAGASRNPFVNPPTTAVEANDAVTVMKGYYARGGRGSWHTEDASHAHENHHYREWKCSCEHYWPTAKAAIEALTVPLASYADEGSAITAMRAGATGADAIVAAFKQKAWDYWFTLSDSAGGRPYAAGQLVLNKAIQHVQGIAAAKTWAVPAGTDSPSPEPPCYQPWLPYTP